MPRIQPRKTIEVEFIWRKINAALSTPDITEDQAKSLAWLLETVLHDTHNYAGYYEAPENRSVHPSPTKGRRYYAPKCAR